MVVWARRVGLAERVAMAARAPRERCPRCRAAKAAMAGLAVLGAGEAEAVEVTLLALLGRSLPLQSFLRSHLRLGRPARVEWEKA